jgi:hypothetical protein
MGLGLTLKLLELLSQMGSVWESHHQTLLEMMVVVMSGSWLGELYKVMHPYHCPLLMLQ